MFIGKYNRSVIVTYLGVLSTMIGFYFILGFATPKITGAIICLMISGICDMFDGKVARMCKNRKEDDIEYGIQIDSLTDMISFIAFPVVILYGISSYFDMALSPVVTVLVLAFFTIAGISRLAYFNLTAEKESGPVKYYSGLPVTATSMILPLIYLLRYVLDASLFVSIYLGMYALIGFLFIYNFKIRKPKKNWWYITCTVLAVIMSFILIWLKVK